MTDVQDIDPYDVAERVVRNKLEIQRLTEENAALTSYWRADDVGTEVLAREGRPTIVVRVTGNSRIDDNTARKMLTTTEYKAVSKTTIDPAKARAFLNPQRIADITKHYDHKVEVSLV